MDMHYVLYSPTLVISKHTMQFTLVYRKHPLQYMKQNLQLPVNLLKKVKQSGQERQLGRTVGESKQQSLKSAEEREVCGRDGEL